MTYSGRHRSVCSESGVDGHVQLHAGGTVMRLSSFVFAMCVLSLCADMASCQTIRGARPEQDRQREEPASVHVSFMTWDDKPLVGWPIGVWELDDEDNEIVLAWGETDDKGQLLLEVPLAKLAGGRLYGGIKLQPGLSRSEIMREGGANRERILELAKAGYQPPDVDLFDGRLLKPEPDEASAHLEFVAEPGITIDVQVRWSDESKDFRYTARSRPSRWLTITNNMDAGRIQFHGCPRDRDFDVFIRTFPVMGFLSVATETFDDKDTVYVDVVLQRRQEPITFQVSCTNITAYGKQEGTRHRWAVFSKGVTLISSDGTRMYSWIEDSGRALEDWNVDPYAPAGVYYIAPGYFTGRPEQFGLYDVIRAGIDLDKHNVPKIQITADEVASIEVDFIQAVAAIRSAMKELEEKRKQEAEQAEQNTTTTRPDDG